MTRSRAAVTTLAAFLMANVFATLIHGFVLSADYEACRHALRSAMRDAALADAFLPVVHHP
jgi:hypothetical protein